MRGATHNAPAKLSHAPTRASKLHKYRAPAVVDCSTIVQLRAATAPAACGEDAYVSDALQRVQPLVIINGGRTPAVSQGRGHQRVLSPRPFHCSVSTVPFHCATVPHTACSRAMTSAPAMTSVRSDGHVVESTCSFTRPGRPAAHKHPPPA